MINARSAAEDDGAHPSPAHAQAFRESLLGWYSEHARTFPWRETRDPFAVLLAEVMLQRTQAPQARRIYKDFVERYPDPMAVLAADSSAVEEQLAGLGLRHRARRVLTLCSALVDRHQGKVPHDRAALAALPGVGPYTVGAVLCFGFGSDAAIVDRNVVRVLTRVFDFRPTATRAHTDRGLWQLAASLVPIGKAAPYNLALLDFAAAVCTVRPRHDRCPLKAVCRHYQDRPTPSP